MKNELHRNTKKKSNMSQKRVAARLEPSLTEYRFSMPVKQNRSFDTSFLDFGKHSWRRKIDIYSNVEKSCLKQKACPQTVE
jgi:hypothetical protein